jgi:hypothetical protein
MRGQAQKLAADPLLKWHAERGKEALRNMERLIADDHFPIGWDERDAVV